MDAVEIAKKRSIPGFMIFDHQRKPVFWSPGVAAILKEDGQDLETEPSGDQKISIPEEITGLISRLRKNDSAPGFPSGDLSSYPTTFITGRKMTYHCRAFFLHDGKAGDKKPEKAQDNHVMVLVENLAPRNPINKGDLKERYAFTDRHLDIIRYLMKGCGNKEIGEVLNISEDTVKAHLKNIMKKLEVSTRSSVISKILEIS